MTVYFIGAGPGAPDLITLRGADLLSRCAVCLYAGSLVPAELLVRCPDGVELINTALLTLDQIIDAIARADARGQDAVRLHSGDVSLYSAFTEQARRLDDLGIAYEIVPGVTAFAAAAAALRQELTVPGIGQSLIITRVSTLSTAMPPGESLAELAATGSTMAIHLAAHRGDQIAQALMPHFGGDCPVAVVAFASRTDEQVLRCRLDTLAASLAQAQITKTAVIFVGHVLGEHHGDDSYLYSASRDRTTH